MGTHARAVLLLSPPGLSQRWPNIVHRPLEWKAETPERKLFLF